MPCPVCVCHSFTPQYLRSQQPIYVGVVKEKMANRIVCFWVNYIIYKIVFAIEAHTMPMSTTMSTYWKKLSASDVTCTSEPSAIFCGKLCSYGHGNAIKSIDIAQNYEWRLNIEEWKVNSRRGSIHTHKFHNNRVTYRISDTWPYCGIGRRQRNVCSISFLYRLDAAIGRYVYVLGFVWNVWRWNRDETQIDRMKWIRMRLDFHFFQFRLNTIDILIPYSPSRASCYEIRWARYVLVRILFTNRTVSDRSPCFRTLFLWFQIVLLHNYKRPNSRDILRVTFDCSIEWCSREVAGSSIWPNLCNHKTKANNKYIILNSNYNFEWRFRTRQHNNAIDVSIPPKLMALTLQSKSVQAVSVIISRMNFYWRKKNTYDVWITIGITCVCVCVASLHIYIHFSSGTSTSVPFPCSIAADQITYTPPRATFLSWVFIDHSALALPWMKNKISISVRMQQAKIITQNKH